MKYILPSLLALLSAQTFAGSFVARCQDFRGTHIDFDSRRSEEFRLNDGTIYEFFYSSVGPGSLKYIIDGTGVIEPGKEDRWHDLDIVGQSGNYLSATGFEGTEQIQFSLYPELNSAQIVWLMQPTKMKPEPGTLLLKASCKFQYE